MKRFDFISVREESGIEICEKSGCKGVICVPDPTLLLNAGDYLDIASNSYPTERYLFVYFLGTRTYINWKEIHSFAKREKLKIVYVASQGQIDKYTKIKATIHDWLGLIAHAEYVITNSFHGTVFSLIFKRKFIVYPIIGPAIKMNDRIITLLKPENLLNRIYSKRNFNEILCDIDYDNVYKLLETNREQGYCFLKSSLQV